MKKLITVLGLIAFFNTGIITAKAEEPLLSIENTIFYDLNQGGLQQFEVEDDLGGFYIITVEEQPQFLRSASSVKNGAYKITKERALQWKASYTIDISNNTIVRAHSGTAKALAGKIISAQLKIDNTKQATYYLKRTIAFSESSINLRAKLLGSSISITY